MSIVFMKLETGIEAKCKAFRPAINNAVKIAIKEWHKDVFPGHFQLGAARKYKYKPRSKRHQRDKRKRGSPPALVFSGYSKRILSMPIRVTASSGQARGAFASNTAMKYFYMTPKGHPNKPAEMKALTDAEIKTMGDNIKYDTIDTIEAVKQRKLVK